MSLLPVMQLIRDFHDMISTRYPRDGVGMSYSDWICANTKLRDRPFSFKGYEFQRAIADDMHPNLWVIKPSQTGISEIQIRKNLAFLARNRGTSSIFTLPSEIMYRRMSKTRVKPLVESERAFAPNLDDEARSKSMDLYEINGSFAYFTGVTEGAATSIPADFLIHDELDLSNQAMIGLFQSRLQNSIHRLTHRFSTPTLPGFAIDAGYNSSDQHEYLCKCSACGHFQIPMFDLKFLRLPGYLGDGNLLNITEEQFAGIDASAACVVCESCRKPLDVLNPELREWVARHPGRRSRGYRVRPFMNQALMPMYLLGQLLEMRRLDNLKGFFNTALGEPYSDGSNQLTDEIIKRCMKFPEILEVGKETPIAIGIDVGRICHVTLGRVVGDLVHPFQFLQIPVDDLTEFVSHVIEEYNLVAGVIDRYPYTPTADAIYLLSGRKIMPVEYKAAAFINVKKDEYGETSYVQINRTAALDRPVNLIRRGMLQISGYAQYEEVLIKHLKDMVRVEAPDKDATWEKVTGDDHFFHSLAYLQIAPKIQGVISTLSQQSTESNRSMFGIYEVNSPIDRSASDIYRTRQTGRMDLL